MIFSRGRAFQAAYDHAGNRFGIHPEFLACNGIPEPVDDDPVDGELDELRGISRVYVRGELAACLPAPAIIMS